jgi:hypothetical protein
MIVVIVMGYYKMPIGIVVEAVIANMAAANVNAETVVVMMAVMIIVMAMVAVVVVMAVANVNAKAKLRVRSSSQPQQDWADKRQRANSLNHCNTSPERTMSLVAGTPATIPRGRTYKYSCRRRRGTR